LNEFVLLQGDDAQHLGKSGTATILVEESGPLIVSLRVESSAPLCESPCGGSVSLQIMILRVG